MSREVVEDELRGRTPRIDSRITPRGQFSVATKKAGETGMTRLAKSLSNINTGLAQYAALSKEEEERGKTIGEEIATSKANLQNIEKEILADEKRLLEQGILRKHQLLGFRKAYYKTGGQRAALEAQNKLRARYKDARINLDDPNFNGESIVEEVYGEFKAQYGENTDFMSGFNPKFDNISAFWMSNFDQIRQKELDRKHIRDVQQVVTLNLEGGAESALEIMNSTADPFMPVDTKIKTFFSGIETYASNVYETKTTAEATAEIDKLMDELETTSTPELGELKNLEGFTALRSRIQNISRRAEDAHDEKEQEFGRRLPEVMAETDRLLKEGDLDKATEIVASLHPELEEDFEHWVADTEGTERDVIGEFFFYAAQDLDRLGVYPGAAIAARAQVRTESLTISPNDQEFEGLLTGDIEEQLNNGMPLQTVYSIHNLTSRQQQQVADLAVEITVKNEGYNEGLQRFNRPTETANGFIVSLVEADNSYKTGDKLRSGDQQFLTDVTNQYTTDFDAIAKPRIADSNLLLRDASEAERIAARNKIFQEVRDDLQEKYQKQVQERAKLNATISNMQTFESPEEPDEDVLLRELNSFYDQTREDPASQLSGISFLRKNVPRQVRPLPVKNRGNILFRIGQDENWKKLEEIDAALNEIEVSFAGSVPDEATDQGNEATALLKAYRGAFGYQTPAEYDPFLLDGEIVRVFDSKATVDKWMRTIQSKEISDEADDFRNVLRVKFGLVEDKDILSFLDKQAQILDIFE